MAKYFGFFLRLTVAVVLLTPALGWTQMTMPATPVPIKNPFYTLDKIWKGDETGSPQLKDPEALSAGRDGKIYIAGYGQ